MPAEGDVDVKVVEDIKIKKKRLRISPCPASPLSAAVETECVGLPQYVRQ